MAGVSPLCLCVTVFTPDESLKKELVVDSCMVSRVYSHGSGLVDECRPTKRHSRVSESRLSTHLLGYLGTRKANYIVKGHFKQLSSCARVPPRLPIFCRLNRLVNLHPSMLRISHQGYIIRDKSARIELSIRAPHTTFITPVGTTITSLPVPVRNWSVYSCTATTRLLDRSTKTKQSFHTNFTRFCTDRSLQRYAEDEKHTLTHSLSRKTSPLLSHSSLSLAQIALSNGMQKTKNTHSHILSPGRPLPCSLIALSLSHRSLSPTVCRRRKTHTHTFSLPEDLSLALS